LATPASNPNFTIGWPMVKHLYENFVKKTPRNIILKVSDSEVDIFRSIRILKPGSGLRQ